MARQTGRQPRRRLHQCDECKVRRWVAWVELNRAGRPRCTGCGSARLELVSEEAKEDRRRLQGERVDGTGGSLMLVPEEENTPHRKVTG